MIIAAYAVHDVNMYIGNQVIGPSQPAEIVTTGSLTGNRVRRLTPRSIRSRLSRTMVTGTMPKWQQCSHRSPVVTLILLGFDLVGTPFCSFASAAGAQRLAITLMIVLGLGLIGSGFWF